MSKVQCKNNGFFLTIRLLLGVGFLFLLFNVAAAEWHMIDEDGHDVPLTGTSAVIVIGCFLLAFNCYLFFKRTNILKLTTKTLRICLAVVLFVLILGLVPFGENRFLSDIIMSIVMVVNGFNLLIYFMSIFESMFIRQENEGV